MLLDSSRYEELNAEVADFMEAYGVSSHPVNVLSLAGRMGIILKPYSSIPVQMRPAFEEVSKDAFTISEGAFEVGSTYICYNQCANDGRMQQSIAHEMAHIWLEHPSSEEPYETEAEYFAAYLLAPIPVILAKNLKYVYEVHDAFGVSYEAARIALSRAGNRRRCGKPEYDYEYAIIDMCNPGGVEMADTDAMASAATA